ncbi:MULTISPECIES: aldose epimerase family protein [Chitinophagaceae]
MLFTINTTGAGEDLTIKVRNEKTGAYIEVYALGAVLNQYGFEKDGAIFNCIDAYQDPATIRTSMTQRFQGSKLSPFVCRLTDGVFSFDGKQYHVGKHFDGMSAIHGLVYDELFELKGQEVARTKAHIELEKKVNADNYGFPFPYTIKVIYSLEENGAVNIETIVTNNSTEAMPLNDGWHPYFKLDEKIDEVLLQFRSKQMAVFSEALLPTGEFIDYKEFATFRPVGKTELDNSFTIDDLDTPALVLKSEALKLQLSVTPKTGYPILQIYIPPTRNSIAVENLTGLPDSFNNHIGLLTLKPNESKHFVTEYHLEQLV